MTTSSIEQAALERSPFALHYPPTEKIKTIVVEHFPALGNLAALRFLEWVQEHPEGVISLPTGKTPEHFIRRVEYFLRNWSSEPVRRELEQGGLDPARRPDMSGLRFVQIDEFYPIHSSQHNSFHHYVRRYYLEGFGLDPARALLIDASALALRQGETLESVWPGHLVDLSLRHRRGGSEQERRQKATLERIDQWCQQYEERIRAWGGIGFFLGGIGPDGHIGFNVRGSGHHSTTRLAETNYETQAAAATDLGGIEISRNRLVITIGLQTITFNPDCVAVIIAAGQAKAAVVRDAIESERHLRYPATALQLLPNARFYLTRGAARLLTERRHLRLQTRPEVPEREIERHLIDRAVQTRTALTDLGREALEADRFTRTILERCPGEPAGLAERVREALIARIERGSALLRNTRFLHIEPHHDDLMLGYLPSIVRHVRDATNTHYFACLTSGFTAVTNAFLKSHLECVRRFIDTPAFAGLTGEGYFEPDHEIGRNRDVWQYLDGVASDDETMQAEGVARRMLRNLMSLFPERQGQAIGDRIAEIVHYLDTSYPGRRDPEPIQQLKGMCREFEAECLWGYFGWNCSNVKHLRLGFYTGELFTEEPTIERDVEPVLRLLEHTRPDVVTIALDPEGSGPDTHYKGLQAVTEALSRYERHSGRSDIRIWGYRNVWNRFHPCEANLYVPVSLNMFAIMQNAFWNTFLSQRHASFPSHEHDGPFSELAQRIQVEQYQMIKTCLGREWFYENPSALIRATRGLVFLRELDLDEFYQRSRRLKQAVENR